MGMNWIFSKFKKLKLRPFKFFCSTGFPNMSTDNNAQLECTVL